MLPLNKTYLGISGDYYEKAHNSMHKSQRFFYKTREKFLIDLMPKKKIENVLEIGFGSGIIIKKLAAKNYYKSIFGMDLSFEAAKYLKKSTNIKYTKVKVLVGDLDNIPFKKGAFDLVILSHVLEHIHNPSKALIECKKILKEDGYLLISFPNNMSLWPLAEAVFDKTLAPKDYSLKEQHIQQLNNFNVTKILKKEGFKINKSGTLYLFSLPVSVLSEKISNFLFIIDKLLFLSPFNMISYILASKQKN
ncbi:MAG: class I SAM-dependent methyltransferase [Candidatus Diapherotrites archaeon]